MQTNQAAEYKKVLKNKLKSTKKSIAYIGILETIANSTHHEAALIKKSGALLTDLYRTLGAEDLRILGDAIKRKIKNDESLERSYHLSCMDAIDFYRRDEGTVSLKLLPVYLKARQALSQLPLRPGLGQLRCLAELTCNLQSHYTEKQGWVHVLPQLIHQSSLSEVDLSLLVLIKHIAVKIKEKTPTPPPMTFPVPCREIGVSDKNSNLYFIPFIQFEPTPTAETALPLPAPDWDRTARLLDGWLRESGYPPASGENSSRFHHGQNPVCASAILGGMY